LRIAVIADIHSNLEALRSVLERIQALAVDGIVCLGDIVGYNANPNECVELIRELKINCVIGNHDACASGLEEPDTFNALALAAMSWTRAALTEDNKRFLAGFTREQRVSDFCIFHGSIYDYNRYILFENDVVRNFQLLAALPGKLGKGFFGHTHVRTAFSEESGMVKTEAGRELKLSRNKRYLINPGSVGQPRDGDPRAAFMVYDDVDLRIYFHRVKYDVKNCQNKIIRAGLPQQLAERLTRGR
jgi:predicted phosphodiesterase